MAEVMGKLRIVSRSGRQFADRTEAGRLLADELRELRGQNPVVLGIPRGGVVVARELARALEGEMDIVISRKLLSPGHPELAMGSVSENGRVFLNETVLLDLGVDVQDVEREKERQLNEIRRRSEIFRRVYPRVPLEGRVVIVTDDGVATGATAMVALWAVRQEHPARLVAAMPVGSEDSVVQLAREADETVCLRVPPQFYAVGQFYSRFEQLEDEDVLQILSEEGEKKETLKSKRE
ncbi:MAG: phosphoribosyltransferase family protein [Dehalococcoidia bacterium]|nr:phosphoribosyltransferase family protein [Dehalococcoidia bacterium]